MENSFESRASTLAIRFGKIVESFPNSIVDDVFGESIKFAKIYSEANKLARDLVSISGQGKRHICIEANKRPHTLIIIVACWLLNWSYTFFDPRQPKDRINRLIKDSSSSVVALCKIDPILLEVEVKEKLCVPELDYCIYVQNEKYYQFAPDTSYIMFTSGSTGAPKGVPISDFQVENFANWLISLFEIIPTDTLTALNPWYFDNSVFDIHLSLLSGSNLVLCDTDSPRNGLSWIDELSRKKPTVWFSVPSLLILLQSLGTFKEERFKSLRMIIFGGEAYPKKQLGDLILDQGLQTQFKSVYGPTEATCICSVTDVNEKELNSSSQFVSLGHFPDFFSTGLHNVYQLDSGELAGELILTGPNVSDGYVVTENRLGKFVKLPDSNGDMVSTYLSGDLVYFNPSLNSYCFLGRRDNQIKRFGIRIELEEIEARLEQASGTTVIADFQADRNLDLCIIFQEKDRVDAQKMKSLVRETLPSYMEPREIFMVSALPQNANGKKDRAKAKFLLNRLIGD
jgi:D-alanine--poly(phosphoribitol) ligase subunit 1